MLVFAILARDKQRTLPQYLNCLLHQTYPKSQIHLYIKTNDNADETPDILKRFLRDFGHLYASVYYCEADVKEDMTRHHDWNKDRFKVLGKLRQDSINYAANLGVDYFVADCDNFIEPCTIDEMMKVRHLGVVSPLLVSGTLYSNYHVKVDGNGYFAGSEIYTPIYFKEIKGCIDVAVVHCTYFINVDILPHICYDDNSGRHEYVIFSHVLRHQKIPQYIDNRKYYGHLTFDV
jgi:hypothetical protein